MKEIEKSLLLTDLCSRLSYGLKCEHFGEIKEVLGVFNDIIQVGYDINDYEDTYIEDIKPYLRPMSSMTEDEKFTYYQRIHDVGRSADVIDEDDIVLHMDWLNEHHFDYRGLIGRGLALEAPDGMYELK